ncbi:alpha/beta fold hydrolase [Nonomuraea sp. NPDC000554]|uniref:alpha/beta fold hydrolase n=1 Tax=Nonomuraea sp. NPDC000554 TaxID=3154259 RepID=UPI003328CDB4
MISRVLLALALSVTPPTAPGDVEKQPCPVAMPDNTTCGFLVAPERRDSPDRKIRVGYAVHVSTAKDRKPDPIVYMSGGPASSSIQLTTFLSQMFPDRDVVAVEQRGSRYSKPRLGCPELAEAMLDRLRGSGDGTAAAAGECRRRLELQGVDLRGYTTREIAADVVALRQALGYPSWNLFGVSYSTRVMLDVAASDPGAVRSVVLDSFLPESVNWYDDAERNLGDTLASLGLKDRFDAAVARLNASPAHVPTRDPLLGSAFTARLTGDDVATIMAEALHGADVIAVAPPLVGALASGRDEVLRPLADAVGDGLASHEFGLYEAVQCQDEVPFNTFTTKSRLFTVQTDKAVCDAWKLPTSAAGNATTQAPVLVVGGQFDPTTPARTSKPAAEALSNARFVEFAGTGHAVFLANACGRRHIAAFVAAPTHSSPTHSDASNSDAARPVADCAPDKATVHPRLEPADLHITGAPYQISLSPWLAAPFALFALVSLVQLVAGALRGRAVTAFAGLAGTAFSGLVGQSVYSLAAQNETALGVGVPALVAAYTWVAAGSAALTLAALALRRRWPQCVAAVVAAGFLVWWFAWFL